MSTVEVDLDKYILSAAPDTVNATSWQLRCARQSVVLMS